MDVRKVCVSNRFAMGLVWLELGVENTFESFTARDGDALIIGVHGYFAPLLANGAGSGLDDFDVCFLVRPLEAVQRTITLVSEFEHAIWSTLNHNSVEPLGRQARVVVRVCVHRWAKTPELPCHS